ncbi:spermidine synthase [Nannocystis bainbridge]|uniref:Fused MFS/spermidine synthase n=1 Tax=Nannocystis bainbridge TaxID=2995303 RepID=A0ABT5DZX6_9BACT|nr:fused MFS/spermidine synthase [Nannocystis bainbridge]MDC0718007.1 fused MFS/spermidine synthase [Nannocystis bainbridge]
MQRRGFLQQLGGAAVTGLGSVLGSRAAAAAGPGNHMSSGTGDAERVLGEGRSRYNHVRVVERGSVRTMLFIGDDGTQFIETRIDAAHRRSLDLDVFRTMLAGFVVHPEPRRILVLGLGGGALPGYFYERMPGLELDAVDIDPEVVRLAQAFFGVPTADPRYRVHVADARLFLQRAPAAERWDMIVLDAFRGVQVPPHLKTAEFHGEVLGRLAAGGVAVANLHNGTRMYPHDRETIAAVYPSCYGFLSEAGNQTTLVASAARTRVGPYELRANARRAQPRFDDVDLLGLCARYYVRRDWERAQVLRDDFPADSLAAAAERNNGSCLRGCTYR